MNDSRPTDRLLSAWLELEAPVSAPDDLRTDIYRATARIRPRPAWLARLGGHHMDVITSGARRRDTRLLPLLALLGLLIAAAVAAVYIGSRRSTSDPLVAVASASASASIATAPPSDPPSVTPATSALADATIYLPYNVLEIIPGDDAMWVSTAGDDTNELPRSIYRIDLATREATLVVTDFPVGASDNTAFVEDAGSIWLQHNQGDQIFRYDSASGELLGTIPVGTRPIESAVAFGAIWSQNFDDGTLTRIDAETGNVVTTIDIRAFQGTGPRGFAVGAELLWVVTPNQDVLVGIDPATNTVAREIPLTPGTHCGASVSGGRVWVADCGNNPQEVFDEASGVRQGALDPLLHVGGPLHQDGPVVWLPNREEGRPSTSVLAIDLTTLVAADRAEVDLGVAAGPVNVAYGSLWYASGPTLYRLSLDAFTGRG
jgi:sugar lactone lactonase YvrE